METNFESVGAFHRKFQLPVSGPGNGPRIVGPDVFLFRYQFLQEELQELLKAYRDQDIVGVADAIVDLVYVALGTAHMFGIPFDEVFREVQRANMGKERSNGDGDPRSKRGSGLDVVKPEGWRPPDVEGIIEEAIGRTSP